MVRHTGEDLIDEKRVTVASMLALQSPGVHGSKLDTPESDSLVTDSDTSLSKKVFYITVAQIESIVEPDGIADDIGWEPVTFVDIHGPILARSIS